LHFAGSIRYFPSLSFTFAGSIHYFVRAIRHFCCSIHYFVRAILHFAGSIRYFPSLSSFCRSYHLRSPAPNKKGMHSDCAFLSELEK
ncbi:hypothetical protein, partial [Lysinibacillus sp.]